MGVLLTPFTAGGSDAGAAALDGAEAGAILGSVEVTLDAAVTDISTDLIADVETCLRAAADGVPEIETVDAEITEVNQELERELAQTEARDPAGVGGRGGGNKPPTGGRGGADDAAGNEEGNAGKFPPDDFENTEYSVDEVASMTYRHTGSGDMHVGGSAPRPTEAEILDTLRNGEASSLSGQNAAQYVRNGIQLPEPLG
ncbi:hypothetical protein [Streptomyces sp. DW26H14]|uniref:hypothetical protein n=1 Tax=Streptomyces sp. DW26H14 TaxID=3435395 RepID=UPI00403D6E15